MTRSVARLVLATAALAAGGCRQIFGIDDTHPEGAPDASEAEAVDAGADASHAGSSCTTNHLLCVDFDSDATGLALLPDQVIDQGGTLTEVMVSNAPTPPRVLRAQVGGGSGAGTAFASVQYDIGQLASSTISFELNAANAPGNPGCDELVFALAWADPGSMSAHEAITVSTQNGSLLLGATVDGVAQVMMHPFPTGTWASLSLLVDTRNGLVILLVDGSVLMVQADLGATAMESSALGIGLSAATDHSDCQVSLDSLVVDRMP